MQILNNKHFTYLYKKYTANSYSFLVIDTTFASDSPLGSKKNLLKRISKIIMASDYKIRDEKIQYDINNQAPKISALLSGKTDKHEYVTGEEILPSNQSQVVKQAKFTYSPFEKKSNLRHRSKINYKFV